jgi:hypothetical protein
VTDLENEMTLAGIDAPNTLDKAFSSFLRIPAAGFRNRATGGTILNTVSFTQSKEPVINLSVVEKMLSFCADVVPEVLDS